MSTIPDQLQEGVLQWVFGDGEEDPGLLVSEGKKVQGLLTWLGELERDITSLKRVLGRDGRDIAGSDAISRLRALKAEIERAQPILFPAQMGDVADGVVSLDDYRRRNRRRLVIGAGIVLALAATLFFVTRSSPTPQRDLSAEVAHLLTKDIVGNGGFGFGGGVEPTAHDRGFLIGAVIDLSRKRQNGSDPGKAELDLARSLATRALVGLDSPDDPENRRIWTLGGCAAILGDDPEREDCEKGMSSYLTARDNVLN